MGGGTTVMPAVHVGALDASRVVGLARAGLSGVERTDGRTTLGATTSARDRLRARPRPRAVVRGRRGRRSGAAQHGHRRRQPRGAAATSPWRCSRSAPRSSSRRAPCPSTTSGPRSSRARRSSSSVSFEDDPDSVYLRWARRAANSPAVVSRGGLARPRGAGRRRPAPGPLAGRRGGRSGGRRGGDRPADRRGGQRLVPAPHDRAVRPASTGGARCRLRSSSSSSTGARPR